MLPTKIIMGIDPGLATTGYGFIECCGLKQKVIAYGTINTKAKTPLPERLQIIHEELTKLIKKYRPRLGTCEELFFAKNTKTALLVAQARGIILLTIHENKIPFQEFTPLQVKQTICGYGRAEKQQIQQMIKILLGLKDAPRSDDAADALAIALTGYQFNNSPLYDQK